ncbi:transcription-associated protein [Sodiomyces alkalinus F11]|uniref:Transcription-associated protein n=1 Tax=Sodiomyces alkalinus (strain CBS 110278 / VKM F-3762 / F11) TaxID=1314773 RepID=A0A3N2PXQ7_SODAK|nr:transcription-associated protein [Sodiomyces alkalinus F11]ROT39320.1 transcription-associated protein [Sodiomyces alkalinus F11]
MSGTTIDDVVKRLSTPDLDPKVRVEAATTLRDSLDHYTTGPIYTPFLKKLMPIFISILRGPCIFQSSSPEQKLRNCILEILHRLPTAYVPTEPFEPYAEEVVDLLMQLVRTDNEDNATLCVKIISDIMRHQHKVLGQKVQPFLSLIQDLFRQMDKVVREQLDNTSVPSNAAAGAPSTPGSSQTNFQSPRPGSPVASVTDLGPDPQQQNRMLLKGMSSFKVLSECPIIVVSLFPAYKNLVASNVTAFVPLIKGFLCLQASAQRQAHADAKARGGDIFTGVSPLIRNRAAFGEFIAAQVKTMSFLAYLLRQHSQKLQDFLPTLPEIVVRLLKDCPREKSSTRKELLVAIRHIINFNFRKIFLPKIGELLDERTLIGDGLTVHETMRPLAYSMLADLIHHVRDQLTPDQIRRTVEVYTKNLQDNYPGTSFQTMSAKLLLNMAECIAKLQDKVDARHYLMMILSAIADKFEAMNRQYPNAVKLSKLYHQQAADGKAESYLADRDQPPDWDETDIFTAMPIKTSNPRERGADPVADNKFLFRNLMNGLKNTFYQLRGCNAVANVNLQNAPPQWQDVAYGFTAEEVKIIVKLFRQGAYVFRYYETEKPSSEAQYTSPVEYMANFYMVSSSKEEKDLLETFATVFHCIDPATFHEVFQQEIPHLYDMIFEHTGLLHIMQFFLASEATSPSFCGMLLRFLMDRIDQVGSADIKRSAILLRLFKLAFMAVTLFANQNEQVLLPHVVDIVTQSIELSTRAEEPMNYFFLLRSLFRSIGGGKFEHLYKQILPLLEMLLDVLNTLLMAARKPSERDLYVELCLTVPARLSNLLPHLSFLMRPLVVALRASTDLVGQGLRTLELCVDNLTADYLDPIMAPVIDELMTALFDHLRPHPYSHFHAHTTMRILGKLGGRNRKYITGPQPLDFSEFADDPTTFDIRLVGSKKDRALPAELGIDLAIRKLMEAPRPSKGNNQSRQHDGYYKKQSFHYIKSQLKLRIGFDNLPDDLPRLLRLQAQDFLSRKLDADLSAFDVSDRERSIAKKNEQDILVRNLLKAIMFAESLPDFKEDASSFLVNVARHFTIVEIGRSLVDAKHAYSQFNPNAGEGPLYISTRVFSDAIVESLSSEHPDVRDSAKRAIREIYSTATAIMGSTHAVARLPFVNNLASTFCHACYEEEWFTKAGGTIGINFLLTELNLGDQWATGKQTEFIRALMYVVKDMPQDLPEKTRSTAQVTLETLLQRVTKNIKKEDVLPVPMPPGQQQQQHHQQQQQQQQQQRNRLPQICMHFNSELSHMNRHVRETAKRSLELIAKAASCEVWELIAPYKDRFLQPIYSKPLRALPFPVQIGYIDAMTYHMTLKHDWVVFDEHLNRLLMESLALADASDESLANKPAEFRTHEYIVNLRVACIKLLSTAMGFDDFAKGQNTAATRAKIVSVFFKSLYSDSKATIDAANDALKSVLQQTNKLPKDLLQGGLRPVLANLQDPKKLTCHGLDNLARLLKLLTTYFKVEIGARLLDHVKVLADPGVLHLLSFTYFEQHAQMKVVAAVFNIFHLLPPAAETFKDRLIDLVLDLEEKLRRTQISPFRAPLYKYLNRYPAEMWAFLLPKMGELKYGRFLAQVLAHPDSGPLRREAVAAVDGLIQTCQEIASKDQGAKFVAVINTVNLLNSLSRWPGSEGWVEKREILAWLRQAGKELESELRNYSIAATLRLPASQALEQVMSIFLKSLERSQKDLDSLLSLAEAVTARDFRDAQPLISYIYKNIINSGSVDVWKAAVLKCLDAYSSKNVSQKMKRFLLHYVVNPIIAMDVQENWNAPPQGTPRLMDRSVIDAVTTKIWKTHQDTSQDADDLSQPGIDHTRFEVLQLSAMLVKYHHQTIQEARKDIIKSCWTFIRLDDVVNKHAAYVVIGYFIALYETPVKIVTQVYVSLLKTNQNEGRALVTQALELIAPVLPKRLGTAPNDRNAAWAVAPRRVLADEGLNIQQMTSTFNFLVRHPDLFYESRDKYAMLLITSLRKVAMPSNASQESKKLALNMMWLIWLWEQRRVEATGDAMARDVVDASSLSPAARKRKLEGGGDQVMSSPPTARQLPAGQNDYQIPPVGRLKMVRYLIEFIAQLNERYQLPSTKTKEPSSVNALPTPQPELYQKAMALLYNLLQPQYWADLDVDLFPHVTEAVLASDKTQAVLATDPSDKDKFDDKFLTSVINTLQIVRIILHFKSDDWIQRNIASMQKVLDKCLKSEIPEVQDCLHVADPNFDGGRDIKPTIKRVLDSVPEDVPMEDADAEVDTDSPTSEFIQSLSAMAGEAMAAGNYTSGVNLLWSLGHRKPTVIDQHIPVLMKALQSKLAREHVQNYTIQASLQAGPAAAAAAANRGPDASPPPGEMSPDDLEISTTLMLRAMQTISSRMEVLGDHRRPFLSVLATLVEKSMHMALCEEILSMVEGWVFRSEGTWPTLKEKTAVLHKMLSFEHRQDPTMLSKFLDLVIRIYEDPKIARTELTVRMEHAFLIGTRAQDVHMRNRFMAIFDKSLSKTATARLSYVLTSQNWDTLADSFWLAQASQLLLGGVELNTAAQLHHEDFRIMPVSRLCAVYARDTREPSNMADDKYDALMAQHRRFMSEMADLKVRDLVEPLGQLQHADTTLAHQLWVALFPLYWSATARDERTDLERGMVTLLTKDYHSRQIDKRPNVVQSLLEGAAKAWPDCKMPPHVLKYEAKTYDAWYTALVQLERAAMQPEVESVKVRESNLDALVDLYATLQEDDMFYGTWRRRCQFVETNAALSYEQNGMWDKAQKMYETAQIKARTGVVPFSQGEYMIWEDHWVLCAQKLQQWDILQDFAKHENFQDLLLECAWRNMEMWQDSAQREALDTLIKGVMDAPTPRRAFFQAFMSLLKFYNKQESPVEFAKSCDEAIQLSIRKWHQLPQRLTRAHVPLLQNFQQLVELHDAQVICQSLAGTTQANLDVKSGELKLLLAAWRDRLPNVWDDITAWQDLVTWRQHIFGLINQTYLQLLPQQGGGQQNTSGASFAYRGYHETAWIINRFAHVARKHNLPEVCISQLSRIYTLPNIEIQEAFLKLREQAKCHYENPEELTSGLDVINNTNLGYFNPPQKAEFYTLKGMFLEKLNQKEEADQAFGTALFFDITAAKAWAEWGYFNERKFKEDPTDLNSARQAVTSYLQAAGSYKNAKSRKLLSRILWLLSLDDASGTIAAGFDDFKGETPIWYWITFIPQLLTGLGHKEAPRVHQILTKIAKSYPQALYFQLRTNREDMAVIKKNQEAKEKARQRAQSAAAASNPGQPGAASPQLPKQDGAGSRPGTAGGEASISSAPGAVKTEPGATNGATNGNTSVAAAPGGNANANANANANGQTGQQQQQQQQQNNAAQQAAQQTNQQQTPTPQQAQQRPPSQQMHQAPPGRGQKRPPWELTEEIMSHLKSAFPLLALSMETMVDQIQKNFKCPPDEDAYRLIVALLNDALAYVSRMPSSYAKIKLPPATETNIVRFAETILPAHIKKSFEADFVQVKPTMDEYIMKLRHWRNKFEEKLDRRQTRVNLEAFSPHLSEFRYQRFDDVEMPGQYLEHKDKNQDFIRIERFLPNVDLVRSISASYRRLRIRGHDASVHSWVVQHPAARHCRREERILQLFRQLNQTLNRRKESRRRDLQFTLPLMVPLAPHIRIVQEDTSYITLQGVYEDHCRRHGMSKDEPVLFTMEKLRGVLDSKNPKHGEQGATARLEVFNAIQEKWVPHTVALEYFQRIFPHYSEFWLFRRHLSYQLATLTFMTYILYMHNRYPPKMHVARASGRIWGSELMSFLSPNKPFFHNPEPVPFRLTPNLQTLMGPLGMEGIFSCALMAVARCLLVPEHGLEHALTLFVRDEMIYWFTSSHRVVQMTEQQLRESVQLNTDSIVKRAASLAQSPTSNLPANQTVIDLIAKAVNPMNLAQCDALWMPCL